MDVQDCAPQNDNYCNCGNDKYSCCAAVAAGAVTTGTMAMGVVSRMKEWENRVWESHAAYEKAQADHKRLFVFENEMTTEAETETPGCCNHSPLEIELAEERLRSAHEVLRATSDDYYLPAVKRQIPVAVYCINEGTVDDPARRGVCDDLLLRRARRGHFEKELQNLARGAAVRAKLAGEALEGRRDRMLDCLSRQRWRRPGSAAAAEVKTEEEEEANHHLNRHRRRRLPEQIGTLQKRTPSSSPEFAHLVLKEAKVAAKYARKNEAMIRRERAYVQCTVLQDLQDEIKAWREFELQNDHDEDGGGGVAVVDFDKPKFLARRRNIASVLAAASGSGSSSEEEEEERFREADRKFRGARRQLHLLNYNRLRVLEPGPDAPRFIVPKGSKIRDEIYQALSERNRIEEKLFPSDANDNKGDNAAAGEDWNNAEDAEREIAEQEQRVVEEWDRKVGGSKLTAYYNWFRNHNGVLKANPSYRWGESSADEGGRDTEAAATFSSVVSAGSTTRKRKRATDNDCDEDAKQPNGKRR